VNKEAAKGVEGRKKRDEESDHEAAESRRERTDREKRKAKDTLEERAGELKETRATLEGRTEELKSVKQSLSSCNRARNDNDREISRLQKQVDLHKKQAGVDRKKVEDTERSYHKVKEANRAKIADLEKELAEHAPILEGLDRKMEELSDWCQRDALLRKEYLLMKGSPPGEEDPAGKLHAAERVLGILDQYLGPPRTGEPPSGTAQDPLNTGGKIPPGWGKGSGKGKDPGGGTQPNRSHKKRERDEDETQIRPDQETYGRLAKGLRGTANQTKKRKLTKRQKQEARDARDTSDWYGEGGECTTADPLGDGHATAIRLQAEAEDRERDLALKRVNTLPEQETRPKTRSSTSSAKTASSLPPSPTISLVETPPDSPEEYVEYAGGLDRPVKDYPSEEDSDQEECRRRRGRIVDDDAEEDEEGGEEEGNEEGGEEEGNEDADPPKGKED
jgi:hypothetical protein